MRRAESLLRTIADGQSRSHAQINSTGILQNCNARLSDLRNEDGGSLLHHLMADIQEFNVYFNSLSFD